MGKNAIAFEVERDDEDKNVGKPGAYYFLHSDLHPGVNIGILHGCPCGCGGRSICFFKGLGGSNRQEWDVEGEWPKVTLRPSIGIKYDYEGKNDSGAAYHWHGYLEDGVFVER